MKLYIKNMVCPRCVKALEQIFINILTRDEVPLSKPLRLNFMVNTDREYMAGLRYATTKCFSVSSHYDSDMGMDAGITLNY